MYDRVLNRVRQAVHKRSYLMTLHAEEEMNEDGLSIWDVENCILGGKIVERQKDINTGEWKYRIQGESNKNEIIEVIVKFGMVGKLVIITVYVV